MFRHERGGEAASREAKEPENVSGAESSVFSMTKNEAVLFFWFIVTEPQGLFCWVTKRAFAAQMLSEK